MKPWHAPSGRQRGIAFFLPDDWSPGQALAVVELLNDLRERIWQHYQIPLHQLIDEQHSTHVDSVDALQGDDPLF